MTQSLKEIISLTAAYYQQPIADQTLLMYCEDLADLPPEEVIAAYSVYRKNPKNRRMPIPAEIRAIVRPEENVEYKIQLLTDKLMTAIRTHGEDWAKGYESVFSPTGKWYFADTGKGREQFVTFQDAFSAQVGLDGLLVLKQRGFNWANLAREYLSYGNPSAFKAHLRSTVEIALQSPGNMQNLLDQMNSILKIEDRKSTGHTPVYALQDGNEGEI